MINTTTTTDKVQVGGSTTGATTTSQWQTYNHYKAEQGWECPRCGRINAPWVRQCDCSRSSWTITCDDSVSMPKEKYINWAKDDCAKPWQDVNTETFKIHPESGTIWKTTPSSDNATISTADPNVIYTHTADTNSIVGGSDYKVSSVTTEYVNTPKTYTNSVKGKTHE